MELETYFEFSRQMKSLFRVLFAVIKLEILLRSNHDVTNSLEVFGRMCTVSGYFKEMLKTD